MRNLGGILFALIAFFFCAPTFARFEVLMADMSAMTSAAECPSFFLMELDAFSHRETMNMEEKIHIVHATRAQIYDSYRELGTVPEEELEDIIREDALFPAQAVIYIRCLSDFNGKVEGIMRLVSGDLGIEYFYNHMFAKRVSPIPPFAPVWHKYKSKRFREFFAKKFPKVTEMGRVVYGKDVNTLRVLMDMVGVAARMAYMPKKVGDDHYFIAESVQKAVHRYTEFGLKEVEGVPITLKDGRILMASTVKDFHDRFVGNVLRAKAHWEYGVPVIGEPSPQEKAIHMMTDAIASVSPNTTLQKLFSFGYYHRAYLHYSMQDFESMRKDTLHLVNRNQGNAEFLGLHMIAEVGTRFNFYTGKGDWKAAIEYLDNPDTKKFLDSSYFKEQLYDGTIHFYKGLVYLASGQIAKAREMRNKIEEEILLRERAAALQGRISSTALPSTYARMRVLSMTERYYDPETGEGNPEDALENLFHQQYENPVGITPELYDYKVKVLAALGRFAEAREAGKIADGLRGGMPPIIVPALIPHTPDPETGDIPRTTTLILPESARGSEGTRPGGVRTPKPPTPNQE